MEESTEVGSTWKRIDLRWNSAPGVLVLWQRLSPDEHVAFDALCEPCQCELRVEVALAPEVASQTKATLRAVAHSGALRGLCPHWDAWLRGFEAPA